MSATLASVPQEVLEHIAFFSATHYFLGPPSTLIPLLSINRKINSQLSIKSNHHLYANIFAHKFDIAPIIRRFGSGRLTPYILARELQQRCVYLKRMRGRLDSTAKVSADSEGNGPGGSVLLGLLFHTYLLMLENAGKNERQLREYGLVDAWLREYWFDDLGASRAKASFRMERWPSDSKERSLAMWLFWFLLKPEDYMKDDRASWTAMTILKVFALGAHKYDLTHPSWIDFSPVTISAKPELVTYYSEVYQMIPPPLATPAILSYLTLVNQLADGVNHAPLTPSHPALALQYHEWECEWGRCLSLCRPEYERTLIDSFRPGSIEGVWEGVFTYTEFTAYAALLTGAPPPVLQKSLVVRHRQTWKLREHHLITSDPSHSDSGIDLDLDYVDRLPAGDPLRSYFPTGTQIRERRDGIDVQEPESKHILHYQRASITALQSESDECNPYVQDIVITGEGHSAWGQFNLVGRVRPCDGFISLSKEYVDGDRGKWLYRGYLVGNINGNLAGRWRDTLSPADVPGYEGCFAMSRRR